MQLDIFDHSRDVMLRNDVLDALQRRDAAAASSARAALANAYPDDPLLAPATTLINALVANGRSAFADLASARVARLWLTDHVQPAAARLFGDAVAGAWLAPLWRQTAERAAALPFSAEHSDEHAAACWLRAGDRQATAAAVDRIESWRRIPAPLAWMAEARFAIDGLDAAWPLLAELAWLSPRRCDTLLRTLADPSIDKLRKRFHASFEGDGNATDLAWFPAWLLTDTPALARWLEFAQACHHAPPEQAMRLLLELLGLERQGRHADLVHRRKSLRDLHAGLYASYMKTR